MESERQRRGLTSCLLRDPRAPLWYSDYWEFLKRVAVSRNVLFCCNFHLVTGERARLRGLSAACAGKQKRIWMSLLVGECSGTCVFAGRSSCASYRKALDREELSVDLLRGRRCSPRSPQLYLACSRQFRRSDEFWKTSHGLKFVLSLRDRQPLWWDSWDLPENSVHVF